MVQEFNSTDTNKDIAKQIEQFEDANSLQEVLMHQEVYADIVKNMQFGLNVLHLQDSNDITSFQLVATNPATTKLTALRTRQETALLRVGGRCDGLYENANHSCPALPITRTHRPRIYP